MSYPTKPWHHGVVTVLAVIFYGLAVLDFALTSLNFQAYIDYASPELLAIAQGFPAFINLIWIVTVFGGALGCYLLWTQSKHAVLLLFIGFVGMGVLTLWMTIFSRPSLIGAAGLSGLYTMLGTCALGFLIYLYARYLRTQHMLA
ncbi:MAG: hypothetical protein ACPGNV_08245 [Mangrovicoccus sp.]